MKVRITEELGLPAVETMINTTPDVYSLFGDQAEKVTYRNVTFHPVSEIANCPKDNTLFVTVTGQEGNETIEVDLTLGEVKQIVAERQSTTPNLVQETYSSRIVGDGDEVRTINGFRAVTSYSRMLNPKPQ